MYRLVSIIHMTHIFLLYERRSSMLIFYVTIRSLLMMIPWLIKRHVNIFWVKLPDIMMIHLAID